MMHPLLIDILLHKQREVSALYREMETNLSDRLARILHGEQGMQLPQPMALQHALKNSATDFAIIAEYKRHSPTQGEYPPTLTIEAQLHDYLQHHAAAISLITEASHFQGSLDDAAITIPLARSYQVPVLRKDFILDEIQLAQTVAAGFDAALLIVSITGTHTAELYKKALALGLDVLVEVHTLSELHFALSFGAQLIGINNRDLHTFVVDPEHALKLKAHVPKNILTIAESGISTVAQAQRYRAAGFTGILVGSALMQSSQPGQLIDQLRGGAHVATDAN